MSKLAQVLILEPSTELKFKGLFSVLMTTPLLRLKEDAKVLFFLRWILLGVDRRSCVTVTVTINGLVKLLAFI